MLKKLFTNKEETPQATAEEKLKLIQELLFPLPSKSTNDKGSVFLTDYSADFNLDGALMDLEEGINDPVVHNTIRRIGSRLTQVRKLLNVEHDIDMSDVKFIIVKDSVHEAEINTADE